MKIDLHCHSKYSKRATLWIMQKLGCPESFTEPRELYRLLRRQGMSAVTITDHNVIDGSLDISGEPHTFISCEYTTYFPEDRCKVHVLAYGITEAQHADLSEVRENIFDLVQYLNTNQIHHVCAHPFFGPNSKLTVEHLEKLVLLFKNWELNGDQNPEMNAALREFVDALNPSHIERLVEKHGFLPSGPDPWRKNFVGGSDDHSSLNLGSTYTEVRNAKTINEFWQGVEKNQARVHIKEATPQRFARNIYGIAYQFYKSKFDLDYYVSRDTFLRFTDRMLHTRPYLPDSRLARFQRMLGMLRRPKKNGNGGISILELARFEAGRLIKEHPHLLHLVNEGNSHGGDLDQQWFDFVDQLSSKLLGHFGEKVVERLLSARIFDLFHSMGSAGALYALLAPYFVSYSHYAQERRASEGFLRDFCGGALADLGKHDVAKVAHFTDTFHEVNGVARTLQQQLATARKLGKDYTIITCKDKPHEYREGLQTFEPMGSYSLPEYAELKLLAPPFLQMLDYCYESGFTHVHVSTPGPVGMAGLAVAKILQLPVAGTYHTALPQYGQILTEDSYVEEVLWRAMIWFYEQLEQVYVPSKATGDELTAKGLNPRKVVVYPRGVDVERFSPAKGNGILVDRFGVKPGEVTMLYVGRVSKEKNLDVLCRAFERLAREQDNIRLVVVGDGPYREEMEGALVDVPATFTGYLQGDDLPAVYASSDVLVFPSTTDTFGNVVLEAQACGIPVIVTDEGGPQENLIPGKTGLIVPGDDADALHDAMFLMGSDGDRRKSMARAAHDYMSRRGFSDAFAKLWEMYASGTATPFTALDLAAAVAPVMTKSQ